MMFRIVTYPEWQSRAPAAFGRRGESYWTHAELPVEVEWVFLIRTKAVPEKCLDARTIAVVSVEKLLEFLADVGEDGIFSVHHLLNSTHGDGLGVSLIRLSALDVAEHSDEGWRRIFLPESDEGELVAETHHSAAVSSMVNRVRLASFPVQPVVDTGQEEIGVQDRRTRSG